MSGENIFSALAKYNSAMDENYLTEAFVFVINSLLQQERPIGIEILAQLCVKNNEFSFDIGEDISVSTQETTEQGRPDIKVSSPDKLIYIEVKHDSPLGLQQLERYKKALEPSTAAIKHVVLLTRFVIDFEEQEEKPYKHVRWFEVYNWLANTKVRAKDPVSIYLIESFKSFLEAKQMSIQKVGWEYINGVPALINLINMIEVAIQGAPLPIYGKSPGWDFRGFYVESKEFWCGIYYNNPLIIMFTMMDKKKFNAKLVETPSYTVKEGRYRMWFSLQLEDKHFFSLGKDEQLEEITKFVKECYALAQQMRVKEE
ncbi:MAG: PD-(D/E)XK nuclease family protein [Dehalococcoidia bacterium]|nr:PD-(D/E)XK nuclease family protein [Dehalococcoidia bacterium]